VLPIFARALWGVSILRGVAALPSPVLLTPAECPEGMSVRRRLGSSGLDPADATEVPLGVVGDLCWWVLLPPMVERAVIEPDPCATRGGGTFVADAPLLVLRGESLPRTRWVADDLPGVVACADLLKPLPLRGDAALPPPLGP